MPEALPDWKTMDVDSRVQRVATLAGQGLSSTTIAAHFKNASRNSVIGLCTRKAIALKAKPPKPPARPKAPVVKVVAPRVPAAPKVKAAPVVEPLPSGLLSIMDLKAHQCRWIEGDPRGEHGYCGQRVQADSSFCPGHHARVFLP